MKPRSRGGAAQRPPARSCGASRVARDAELLCAITLSPSGFAVHAQLAPLAQLAQRGDRQHSRAMIDADDLDELGPAAGASLAIALLACCLIVCCSVLRMLCSCTEALRDKLHEVIFEADTLGGKVFDVSLLVAILASVSTCLLYTSPSPRD